VVRKVRAEPRRAYVPQDKFRRTVASGANEKVTAEKTGVATSEKKSTKKPSKSALLESLLKERFHFEKFLPGQKSACMSVLAGKDTLLVRPSGSGKSLCYQLAGAALGGVTIIFSAHEDWLDAQVNTLREKNFAADCIHAGRSREEMRAACVEYLNGRLDFLFVAPERLSVAGFPEMLAKHKPALIAIEEADRIVPASESYLADYALLGEHLSKLRPAPMLALSSTAIEPQQKEILTRLGMSC
jgi:DNA topoisomerase-3